MDDVKLLPCPWCGEGNSVVEVYYCDASHSHRVGCGACGVSTGIHPRDRSAERAVATWNTRAHHTERLQAEVEALRAELSELRKMCSLLEQARIDDIGRVEVNYQNAKCDAVRWHKRATTAEAQRDMLAEALRAVQPFVDHAESCGDHDAYNHAEVQSCGCGLDGAKESADEALARVSGGVDSNTRV